GCCASASEKVLPPCTESASASVVRLRTGLRSCFDRTLRERKRGRPESIRVASCRVKIIKIFDFTFCRWKRVMPVLRFGVATTGAAVRALRGRFTFPSRATGAFPCSYTPVGKSPACRKCPMASLAELASTEPVDSWPRASRATYWKRGMGVIADLTVLIIQRFNDQEVDLNINRELLNR